MMVSVLVFAIAIGPTRRWSPVALGWGVLGRAEAARRGAVVVACGVSSERWLWFFCLWLEASVLLFLTSVWEVTAAGESKEDTESGKRHNIELCNSCIKSFVYFCLKIVLRVLTSNLVLLFWFTDQLLFFNDRMKVIDLLVQDGVKCHFVYRGIKIQRFIDHAEVVNVHKIMYHSQRD